MPYLLKVLAQRIRWFYCNVNWLVVNVTNSVYKLFVMLLTKLFSFFFVMLTFCNVTDSSQTRCNKIFPNPGNHYPLASTATARSLRIQGRRRLLLVNKKFFKSPPALDSSILFTRTSKPYCSPHRRKPHLFGIIVVGKPRGVKLAVHYIAPQKILGGIKGMLLQHLLSTAIGLWKHRIPSDLRS